MELNIIRFGNADDARKRFLGSARLHRKNWNMNFCLFLDEETSPRDPIVEVTHMFVDGNWV